MSSIHDSIRKIFPSDFQEFFPVKKHWWEKIDFENLKTKQGLILSLCTAIILIPGIYYYNKFIALSRYTEMESAQIEVMMQRRKDISINMAHMVMDYVRHEREMFKYAIDKKEGGTSNVDVLANLLSEKGLGDLNGMKGISSMDKIMALAEAYPDLKASAAFQIMQSGYINSEDKIAERRMAYNEAASNFHAYVRKIPACFYAWVLGYREVMFHYADTDKDLDDKDFRIMY